MPSTRGHDRLRKLTGHLRGLVLVEQLGETDEALGLDLRAHDASLFVASSRQSFEQGWAQLEPHEPIVAEAPRECKLTGSTAKPLVGVA